MHCLRSTAGLKIATNTGNNNQRFQTQLFKEWITPSNRLIAIQQIRDNKLYCTIHCIEIHPVDSVFHPLNNQGLIFPQGEYIFEAFELKASQAKSKSTLYHLDLYPSLEKKRKLAYTKSVTFKLLHLLTHILYR